VKRRGVLGVGSIESDRTYVFIRAYVRFAPGVSTF
jgi:hypothetical protein